MMMSQAITWHGRHRIPVWDPTSIYTSIHPSPALESEEEGVAICECQPLNLSPQQKSINSLGGPQSHLCPVARFRPYQRVFEG